MNTLKEDINRAVIAIHREEKKEWISLKEIYDKVEKIRKAPNPNNGASIRHSLETHCEKSEAFKGVTLYDLKQKGTGLYKSIYYEDIMKIEDIKIGDFFTSEQVKNLFKISGQSGMMKSNRLDAMVLISSDTNGVYNDSGIVDGKLLYTGEGLKGDQQLKANNKTLHNSLEDELQVYLFTKDEKRIYTYEGKVKLYDTPFQTYENDIDGNRRKVWKFPLQIIYTGTEQAKQEDADFLKIVDEIETIDENVTIEVNESKLVFVNEPLKIRKYRESSEKRKSTRTAKPEYIASEIIKNKQGVINENVIYQHELDSIIAAGANEQAEKMKDFFENRKDDEGYDILSYELNEYGEYIEKYIEVKSTKGDEGTPIDISDNEVEFAKKNIKQYYIYRIIKSDSKDRYVKVVKGKELFDNYKFIPTMYKIYSK